MSHQQKDFYRDLRRKMQTWLRSDEGRSNKWAEYLMLAPDLFHLLCELSADKDVPVREKAKLAGAIAYFISPLDLIPETITGPIGYVDDIALAAYVLNGILNKTNPDVLRRHWAGDEDVLVAIQHILQVAENMVGKGLWKKMKKLLGD